MLLLSVLLLLLLLLRLDHGRWIEDGKVVRLLDFSMHPVVKAGIFQGSTHDVQGKGRLLLCSLHRRRNIKS